MRRTKEDAEQTRKAILQSAMDIFYEKGYSKTTFDEIAKRINLTKGAVYWYFRNKPDIVATMINEFSRVYLEKLNAEISNKKDIDFNDIINMELTYARWIREDEKTKKFVFFLTCQMEWSESIITKINPLVEDTKHMAEKILFDALSSMQKNGKIRKDINILMITEILITMYAGMLEGFLAKRMESDFDEIVKTGFNLIFNSIKVEGTDNGN